MSDHAMACIERLAAERDALKDRVAELEAAFDRQARALDDERGEKMRLEDRVAELEKALKA